MRKFSVLAALLFTLTAQAQTTITGLPAGAALGGTEPIPADQAGATVKTTPAAIETYSRSTTATLTNKTLTAPVINSPTGIVKADVGLGNVDNTSDVTKNAATVTLTNKTISGAANTISNVSLTTGVTGTLPVANGGTGQTALSALTDNPTASVGPTAVNGSASTFMRSDAAPAVDLTAAYLWTGVHTASSAEPRRIMVETDQGADLKNWDWDLQAGIYCLRTRTDLDGAGVNAFCTTRGATTAISNVALGNATNNPTGTWLGTGTFTFGGGISAGGGTLSGGIATMGRFVPSSSSVPTTGINLPAANTLGLSTNSTLRVRVESTGQVALQTVGAGLSIAEGSNAKMGTCTLVAGTCTFTTTAVTANSRIFCTAQSLGTVTAGQGIAVSARTAGTSYTVTSGSAIDTSVIACMLVEPS